MFDPTLARGSNRSHSTPQQRIYPRLSCDFLVTKTDREHTLERLSIVSRKNGVILAVILAQLLLEMGAGNRRLKPAGPTRSPALTTERDKPPPCPSSRLPPMQG